MDTKKIFFSYARADASEFALKLATDLKKEGFNVWIDQQDIRAGSEWDLEIQKALEACDCLLFIESEKSVASNNVLDEVYYALDQQKMVIPIIIEDSKTPFRLQRLQFVDFAVSYEKGLSNLIRELSRGPVAESTQYATEALVTRPATSFFSRPVKLILLFGTLLIIAAVAIIYALNQKKEPIPFAEDKQSLPIEKVATKEQPVETDPITDTINKTPEITTTAEKKPIEKAPGRNIIKSGSAATDPGGTAEKIMNLHETYIGNWQLTDVDPTARLKRGFLKIEEVNETRVKIQSSFQFFYFKTNDTAFLTVFNGFASCNSCPLKDEFRFIEKDIAIASQKISISAGDTTMDAGANNTIYETSVTLDLVNKNTILIKVKKTDPVTLSYGLVVKPFTYSFRFTRSN